MAAQLQAWRGPQTGPTQIDLTRHPFVGSNNGIRPKDRAEVLLVSSEEVRSGIRAFALQKRCPEPLLLWSLARTCEQQFTLLFYQQPCAPARRSTLDPLSFCIRRSGRDHGEQIRQKFALKYPKGFYHGMTVKFAGERMVLTGMPAQFVAEESERAAEQLVLFG